MSGSVWNPVGWVNTAFANFINFLQYGVGAIVRTIEDKLRDGIDVKDFGAVGDGVTDDLPALILARTAAGQANKELTYSAGVYGISDIYYLHKNGCNRHYFKLGAEIKLLNPSSVGGTVAASDGLEAYTEPLYVHNITVNANNFPGENGLGLTHSIGSFASNVRVKNTVHSSTSFGGKAIQWEGGKTTNSTVNGYVIENCSIGLDFGAQTGVQTVHISAFNGAMYNVDVPYYVNDTNNTQAADNTDSLEILVNGASLRNCGRLHWAGANPLGGGIFCFDRGYGATFSNIKITNDKGGYGSTAYGIAGGLIRGTPYGVKLDAISCDADLVAVYNYELTEIQSPGAATVNPYVWASDVQHFGNLDYVVKSQVGIGIGKANMQVELGSTLATLAGIMDVDSAAITSAYLEVVDRDNNYLTSGIKSLFELNVLGNSLGAFTQGYPAPAQMMSSWTPIDASGAGLTFASASGWWMRIGKVVTLWGTCTYPATADATSAKIGGFPFTTKNAAYSRSSGVITVSTVSAVNFIYIEANSTAAPLLNNSGAAVTNAQCSGATIAFMITYPLP